MLTRGEPDPKAANLSQAQIARLLECCKSRAWRMRNLYWIKDKTGMPVKFNPNEVQLQLEDAGHNRNLILKSRQHGVTTYYCLRTLDTCLFKKNTKAGIIAHKKEDAIAFFNDKVMYAYENLPWWLQAIRPIKSKDNTGKVVFENGSQIVVSLSHRGGTLQVLHISEYGPLCAMYPKRAAEVNSGALNTLATGGMVSIESTAYGAFGDFYVKSSRAMTTERLVRAGQARLTELDYKFHFFAWWQDSANTIDPEGVPISPEMAAYFDECEVDNGITLRPGQKAWYVKKAEEQTTYMGREHPSTAKEAFAQAIEGAIYGKQIVQLEKRGQILQLPIIPGLAVNTFWDIGHNDTTCILFHQQVGPWHNFIDFYENNLEQVDHYARILRERGYLYGRHYLPHDGDNTDWSASGAKTRRQKLQSLIDGKVFAVERIPDQSDGIEMVRAALPVARFDTARCGENPEGSGRGLLPALRAYRYQWNEKVSAFHDQPLHDWASNPADCLRTWAEGYPMQGINDETAKAKRASRKTGRNWRTS